MPRKIKKRSTFKRRSGGKAAKPFAPHKSKQYTVKGYDKSFKVIS